MIVSQKSNSEETNVENLALSWHIFRDFLAVSSYKSNDGGEIGFFTKQGGKSFFKSKKRQFTRGNQIIWHTKQPILLIGWDNGKLSLIDPIKGIEEDITGSDLTEICVLCWNSESEIAYVGDINGKIASFKIDPEDFSKSKFLNKTNFREEFPVSIVSKNVKIKPTSAQFSTRKLAKQEAFNDSDALLLSSLSETKKRALITETTPEIFVKDNAEHVNIFYVGTNKGAIYSFDSEGNHSKVFQCDNGIIQLLDVPESDFLLATTDSLLFYQLVVDNKRANEKIRIKLTGKKEYYKIIFVENQVIAICYGERELRIWDLDSNDNALFRLQTDKGYSDKDVIICLSYSVKKNMISAGTSEGKIARWKKKRDMKEQSLDQQWKLQSSVETDCHIASLEWSPTTAALVVNSVHSVTIFRDEGIQVNFDVKYAAIQKSPQVLSLVRLVPPLEAQDVNMPFIMKGFRLADKFLTAWDEQDVHVFEIKDSSESPLAITTVATFPCSAKDVTVYGALVIVLEETKMDIRTFQGTVRQTLNFREIEGSPMMLDINGKFMAVATTNGYLSVFDISKKDIKSQFQSSQISKTIPNFEKFQLIRVNSTGNRVSFTSLLKNDEIYEKLLFWDAETDSVGFFSFNQGITDQQQYEADSEQKSGNERPKTAAARKIEREQSRFKMSDHYPGNHVFDKVDPRFLICEAVHITGDQSQNLLVSMYVTTEHGVQMHDLQPKSEKAEQLLHLSVPYLYFLKNMESDEEDDASIERSISHLLLRRTLREFVGLDDSDSKAINAMLDFSFYLCMGQMDNAFKSIKYIKNESVWDHMARMCVKTRRIDVARVCLGNMENARAARNLRLSIEREEPVDIQAARLAIELGMIDEAKAIYLSIKRYDMLNKLLQTENKWDEAFKIAEKYDRINLRNTYFNYARYLEENGALEAAIENYELSGCQKYEIPRCLFNNPKVLEIYVKRRKDPDLQKWWGHYLESIGDIITARNFYKISGAYLDVVRLLSLEGQLDEAATLVNETNNRAAAFHLARQYEIIGDFQNAVTYFSKAHAYGSAIRLAKEHEMSDKLANLALQAGGSDLVEAAKYYEDRPGHTDKAVMLYHKAGMIGRALDLAFRTEQHSALDLIVQELDENSDPNVLERAAQFFANNQQDRKAIQLLAYGKKYLEAVNLCRERNVIINEELADLLTPSKSDKSMTTTRNHLLEEIAKCCLHQGNYHFAAKKFTQAGNKIEAMRALLKSGDTSKIILFTNTARNKDIYRMAGNYLQTLAWRDDMDLMRSIESFYVKADALDSLASFYKACAEVEIDEYKDYEKGLNAMIEALKTITKKINKNTEKNQRDLNFQEELENHVKNIERFVQAKNIYSTDPGACLKEISALLEVPGIEESVRRGDLFAVLILHNAKRSNFKKAYQYIEDCTNKKPKIDIKQFLNNQILDQICDEVGKPRITAIPTAPPLSDDEADNGIDYSHALRRRMSNGNGYQSDDDIGGL